MSAVVSLVPARWPRYGSRWWVMTERVWRTVEGAQWADAAENQRSSRSPTVPARVRAWPASSTRAASSVWAWRRLPWTVLVSHRWRPASGRCHGRAGVPGRPCRAAHRSLSHEHRTPLGRSWASPRNVEIRRLDLDRLRPQTTASSRWSNADRARTISSWWARVHATSDATASSSDEPSGVSS
jgi:hypothetical protein